MAKISAAEQKRGATKSSRRGERVPLSDEVANGVLSTILSNGLKPGDPLPSERELEERYEVSRTVIREAIKGLAAKGVIDVRMGRGPRVASVTPSAATEALGWFLHGSQLGYEDVHEVRLLLETHVAALAANRATPHDIDQIRAAHGRMQSEIENVEAATYNDLEFHRAIARAAHNDIYLVLLDSICSHLLAVRKENLEAGSGNDALLQHEPILISIEERDCDAARMAMAAHLEAVARTLNERRLKLASSRAMQSGQAASALDAIDIGIGKGDG